MTQGGTLIFSYIRMLGPFLNFTILAGFQKDEYFFGYEDSVDMS